MIKKIHCYAINKRTKEKSRYTIEHENATFSRTFSTKSIQFYPVDGVSHRYYIFLEIFHWEKEIKILPNEKIQNGGFIQNIQNFDSVFNYSMKRINNALEIRSLP
jgi:hypothetical protein